MDRDGYGWIIFKNARFLARFLQDWMVCKFSFIAIIKYIKFSKAVPLVLHKLLTSLLTICQSFPHFPQVFPQPFPHPSTIPPQPSTKKT
jgi:hypothetical protein